MILGKVHGKTWTEITHKDMPIDYDTYYHLSVVASGNKISCYVNYDGTKPPEITEFDSDFKEGSIGVRHWQAATSYKNLKVSSYTPEVNGDTYSNPILGSCADPDVMYYNGTYFMYPTNTSGANQGFKVYTSTDLVNWTDKGWDLSKKDVYGTGSFWAPDVIERDGIFYMYYVANEHPECGNQ